jgi:hypothetical protein
MKTKTRKAPTVAAAGALDFVKTTRKSPMEANTNRPDVASKTLRDKAWEARERLEQADMRLAGVRAAHHTLHNDAESDSPLRPELLYTLLLILDDALEEIRSAMEQADYALMLVHRGESDGGR